MTGEITMNKKIVLAQVAAIYIAMIGVGNAAPPELGPVPVEVINTPLQVTVTDEPTVRVPYQGAAFCDVTVGEKTCYDDIIPPEVYPAGTNVFVFQSLSLEQTSGVNNTLFGFALRAYYKGSSYLYSLPYETGGPLFEADGSRRVNNEIVNIYHDGDRGDSSVPASLIFWFSDTASALTSKHAVYFTGYFTYLP